MYAPEERFLDGKTRSQIPVPAQVDPREHLLEKELETERMRLAACGCIALANTDESAREARQMHPDYWSASCDDVARSVDKQMAYRKALLTLRQILATPGNDLVVKYIDSVLYA